MNTTLTFIYHFCSYKTIFSHIFEEIYGCPVAVRKENIHMWQIDTKRRKFWHIIMKTGQSKIGYFHLRSKRVCRVCVAYFEVDTRCSRQKIGQSSIRKDKLTRETKYTSILLNIPITLVWKRPSSTLSGVTFARPLIIGETNPFSQHFHDGGPYHKKPAHWRVNQWTGFFLIGTSIMNELNNIWIAAV